MLDPDGTTFHFSRKVKAVGAARVNASTWPHARQDAPVQTPVQAPVRAPVQAPVQS